MSDIIQQFEKAVANFHEPSPSAWAQEVNNQLQGFKTSSDKACSSHAGTGGPGSGENGLGPLTIESSGGDSALTSHGPFAGGGGVVGDQASYAYKIPHPEDKGRFGHN